MDSHTRTLIDHMSRRTRTALTDRHQHVLEYAYQYFARHKTGPLYQGIYKHTGVDQQELDRIFPNGLASVYTWVGIPVHSGQKICKPAVSVQVDALRQVYLDHAATTPLRPEVVACLEQLHTDEPLVGNPSSSHRPGKRAYELLAHARSRVAACLKASPDSIVFTSGGSEANNLAIKGVAFQHLQERGRPGHIVSTGVEHASVSQPLRFLEKLGFQITRVEVGRDGVVAPAAIARALTPQTALVAVMAVNNETGVMNLISEIGRICKQAAVPLLVDAVQCFGRHPLIPSEHGISLLSLSGHKLGAPKGVGALYLEPGLRLEPLIHGGEQEQGLRAGTENVAGIHALGLASTLACESMDSERARLLDLHAYFLRGLHAVERRCIVNGHPEQKLPHVVNIGFEGIDSGSLLLSLGQIGVSVSAGSACTAGKRESSHVLRAMGVDTDRYGTIRFSFGLGTSRQELDYLLRYLPPILAQLRKLS